MNDSAKQVLKVLVLYGGPDREREVSLQSGAAVAGALGEAGHDVRLCDIGPDDLSCLDDFAMWGGDVVFPALHGAWGEGGPLQALLEARGLRFVGCGSVAAAHCMDKYRTKVTAGEAGIPTAPYELLGRGEEGAIGPPLVIKAPTEGSSVDLLICKDAAAVAAGCAELFSRHETLLFEKYVDGLELTVGVLGNGGGGVEGGGAGGSKGYRALAPIQIVPAAAFYDYEAKYTRDDTQYRFEIDLPDAVLGDIRGYAERAFEVLGCRDLSRVDFLVDGDHQPYLLEVNTLPGFTSHSLLPMAAAHGGMGMVQLVDHLVQLAMSR